MSCDVIIQFNSKTIFKYRKRYLLDTNDLERVQVVTINN